MEPNSMSETERTGFSTPEWECGQKVKPEKPSRAAEYIAALYVALLLCTPWLVRDALTLTPPTQGVEMQIVSRAIPLAADEKNAPVVLPAAN
jgi:hypothetical protein